MLVHVQHAVQGVQFVHKRMETKAFFQQEIWTDILSVLFVFVSTDIMGAKAPVRVLVKVDWIVSLKPHLDQTNLIKFKKTQEIQEERVAW